MSDPTSTDALQAALQGEYAAVYGYGLAAGALRGTPLDTARRLLDAHRSRRDRLRSLLLDSGAVPGAAAPAYAFPIPPGTASTATAALAGVEQRLAAVYADLVAASTGPTRALAVTALSESTVRSVRWSGRTVVPTFPGLPERAPVYGAR